MSTYVLVHGAWRGSWCWKRVRRSLQSLGHEVFTPTLTGMADRVHLLSEKVDLETHITDVANLILFEELSDVVLCGHSYGGAVISGVADLIPDRIRSLVYLDAFVLENGESVHAVTPETGIRAHIEAAIQRGEGWKVPAPPAKAFNINDADGEWVDRQTTMQPLATFQQPIKLTGAISRISNVTYILATGWPTTRFSPFYSRAEAKGWNTLTISAGHDVMLDRPEELVQMLLASSLCPHNPPVSFAK
jgi:pimeloyl-ACP methyl ester carboxylesterase